MDEVTTGGPEDRLLLWGKVRDIVGLSRTTAWRLQQRDEFPKPVRLSPGRVGWWESELNSWKRARGAMTAARPPRRPGGVRGAAAPTPPTPVVEVAVAPSASALKTAPSARSRPPNCPGQADFGF